MGLKGGWVSAVWGGSSRVWEQLLAKLWKESASYSLENPVFPFVILFSLTPSSLCVCLSFFLSLSLLSPLSVSVVGPPPVVSRAAVMMCVLWALLLPQRSILTSSPLQLSTSCPQLAPRFASFSSLLFLSPHLSDLRLCPCSSPIVPCHPVCGILHGAMSNVWQHVTAGTSN